MSSLLDQLSGEFFSYRLMNCRISGRMQSQLSQYHRGYDVSEHVHHGRGRAGSRGSVPLQFAEMHNWQQCHGGSLLVSARYFKSSALVATQTALAGGYYQVRSLRCMTCFTELS